MRVGNFDLILAETDAFSHGVPNKVLGECPVRRCALDSEEWDVKAVLVTGVEEQHADGCAMGTIYALQMGTIWRGCRSTHLCQEVRLLLSFLMSEKA
jgi:hypothetical protein